jgi:hypothetical protein
MGQGAPAVLGTPGGSEPPASSRMSAPGGGTEVPPPAGMPGGATEVLPAGGRPGGATEVLPPAGRPGGGTEVLPPAGMPGGGTARMPAAGPPNPPTRRMPAYGPGAAAPPPRGYHPSDGGTYNLPPVAPPPPAYGREPAPRRGGGGGVIAAVVVGVLLLGGGVVWATMHSGGDQQVAADASPSAKTHASKRRTSHGPPHRPTRKKSPTSHPPTAKKTAKTNPFTPAGLCGGGFHEIDRHGLGTATAYLLYNDGNGANCVVTMVPKSNGDRPAMTASLAVKDGGQSARSATNPFYAGPVRLPAKGKCVRWGGSSPTGAWTSGWTHCG